MQQISSVINNLCEMIRAIDADERYHYPNATIAENAPLALIQLNLETRVALAQEILASIGYEGPEMLVRKGPQKV